MLQDVLGSVLRIVIETISALSPGLFRLPSRDTYNMRSNLEVNFGVDKISAGVSKTGFQPL